MAADRFLGAGWASVHGPSDAREMLIWTLDQGFAGLFAGPAPRLLDWAGLRAQRRDLPFRFVGGRVSAAGAQPREGGLASASEGERNAALAAVREGVERVRALGCDTVVLEAGVVEVPGEVPHRDLGDPRAQWDADAAQALWQRRRVQLNRALDAACRSLYAICRSWPDMRFCLSTSRDVLGLGEPEALGAIFEDLSRLDLSYWHDSVAGRLREIWLGESSGESLEQLSNRLAGMSLGDLGDGRVDLPPGAGSVDFPLLAAYRQRVQKGFPVVVELEPGVEPGEIPGIHAFLDKFGL